MPKVKCFLGFLINLRLSNFRGLGLPSAVPGWRGLTWTGALPTGLYIYMHKYIFIHIDIHLYTI